ncbi:MAG: complex I NDUFA9 subunit family protein [Verrucomicrobiales bacterium]|nr:complex I NDUFA9 subunit family protein [Verrucomicrobiales bacterium]
MEIFLTGGTGFVGRVLVEKLVADGHRIRLLIRPDRRPRSTRRPDVATHPSVVKTPVNPWDSAALSAAMRGVDAVVHLVGIIGECGDQTFEAIHIRLTRILVEAARMAGVQRWIHMSALGTRPAAVSRYHQTKWESEECVRSGLPSWTIFRPSVIYGPEDEFTHLFARLAAWSPFVPILGSGHNLLQPIAVERVAEAFAGALTRPEAVQRHFDLAGPERLSLEEIVRAVLHANGLRRWLLHVPIPVARGQARLLEWFWPPLMGSPAPLSRDQLRMLQEDNVGEPDEANRLFGLVHEPFATGIGRFYVAARSNRPAL